MDISIEKGFIEKFINKQYKERISFELTSKKKRMDGIERFSHDTELIIDKKYLIEKGRKLEKEKLEKYSSDSPVYVLSYEHSDGIFMEYDQALDYLSETPSLAILLFKNICIIKSEWECNQSEYYILQN